MGLMGIEFMSVLKPGPVYVGTLLSEMGEDILKIRVRDDANGSIYVHHGDWQRGMPVYILNKEVKEYDTYVHDGECVLAIRV